MAPLCGFLPDYGLARDEPSRGRSIWPLMRDAREFSPSCREATIGSGGETSAPVDLIPQLTRELTSFSNAAAISSISDSDCSNAV